MKIFLRSVFTYFFIVLVTIILPPIFFLFALFSANAAILIIGKLWCKLIMTVAGVKVRVERADSISPKQPCIFVSNHQGTFDVFAVGGTFPVPFRIPAKKELFKIPIFGWALSLSGFPKIDRGNSEQAIESIERAKEKMIKKGYSMFFFPEATRNKNEGILPFKKGAFVVAIQTALPVVPVTISGSREIQKKGDFLIHPGEITITFHPPIKTTGLTVDNRDTLIEKVRTLFSTYLDEPLMEIVSKKIL